MNANEEREALAHASELTARVRELEAILRELVKIETYTENYYECGARPTEAFQAVLDKAEWALAAEERQAAEQAHKEMWERAEAAMKAVNNNGG